MINRAEILDGFEPPVTSQAWSRQRLVDTAVGLLAVGLVCAAAVIGASNITHLYLRQDASMLVVLLCLSGAVLAVNSITIGKYRSLWPVFAYLLWSALTLVWSVAPASTFRASMWALLYLCAALVGIRWPSKLIAVSTLALLSIVASGVDILLVSQGSFLKGVWFNKNVQGAQFLLLGPLLFKWIGPGRRFAPYVALILGAVLFFAGLTRSAAAQMLLGVGILSLFSASLMGHERIAFRKAFPAVLMMLLVGSGLAYLTIRPLAVQVFGVGAVDPACWTVPLGS